MSNFSAPHGIIMTDPADYTPSARVVAEYADYNRDFLLFRIDSLETDLYELSEELAGMYNRAQRAERLLHAAADVYRHGADPIAEEIAEAVAAAAPKRRKRNAG